jgi:endoglucanase
MYKNMMDLWQLINRLSVQLAQQWARLINNGRRYLPQWGSQPLPYQPRPQPQKSLLGFRAFTANFAIAVLVVLAIGLYSGRYPTMAGGVLATPLIQAPLSTHGADIVDATGRTVLLRGVNWFGLETETHAPHGLWSRDYKEMLAQMKTLGYNVIRLPYSVQALADTKVSGIDFSLGSNQELRDQPPLEVMDRVIQEAGRQGLLVLLDSHRLNNQRIPELWYGDGFTEANWIQAWTMLAQRYKNQPNVIGADLKNEPHGRASWGTNDPTTDWRLAAERAGNAILKVNPNWLIVVEGVENNVPGQKLKRHWMGGNLEGVQKFPVRLAVRHKVVYSPHEYGAGVFKQAWFAEANFPKNLESRWDTGFYYIARQKIAPILIGEFGGRQVDAKSPEGIWQRQLVDFIRRRNLSFAYWSWNPNSADTGGILLDDWKSIDQPKQTLLSQLLPAPTMRPIEPPPLPPSPSPASSPKPQARPKPSVSPRASPQPQTSQPEPGQPWRLGAVDLRVKTVVQSDWETGFCVSLPVTNLGPTPIANWRLTFQMDQAAINQSWNGTFNRKGRDYTVIPADWGRSIQPSQAIDMGFCATKAGPDYMPKRVVATAA